MIEIINEKSDTKTKLLSNEVEAYSKFQIQLTKYPLIDSYNALIDVSNGFNESDEKSVGIVFMKSGIFVLEAGHFE